MQSPPTFQRAAKNRCRNRFSKVLRSNHAALQCSFFDNLAVRSSPAVRSQPIAGRFALRTLVAQTFLSTTRARFPNIRPFLERRESKHPVFSRVCCDPHVPKRMNIVLKNRVHRTRQYSTLARLLTSASLRRAAERTWPNSRKRGKPHGHRHAPAPDAPSQHRSGRHHQSASGGTQRPARSTSQ